MFTQSVGYSKVSKVRPAGDDASARVPVFRIGCVGAAAVGERRRWLRRQASTATPQLRIFYFNAAGLITAQWYQSAVNEEEQQRELPPCWPYMEYCASALNPKT